MKFDRFSLTPKNLVVFSQVVINLIRTLILGTAGVTRLTCFIIPANDILFIVISLFQENKSV